MPYPRAAHVTGAASSWLAPGALAKTLGPVGILANRIGLAPAAVAELVAFLAASGAEAITGQVFHRHDVAA